MARGKKAISRKEELVFEAATIVIEIFKSNGISCAIFGSLASKLYGAQREPKDVDILVIQNINPPDSESSNKEVLSSEELKALVFRTRPGDFYLREARDTEATYKVLYFRPSPSATRPARTQKQIMHSPDPECKVDILVPGIMHLPHLRPELMYWHSIPAEVTSKLRANIANRWPLVPFSLLLAHKLQGWDDNRKAEEEYKRERQHKDAKDVKRLLALTQWVDGLKEKGPEVWDDAELFSDALKELTKERVKEYSRAFPRQAAQWSALGF
ncbi:hypothetical protein BDZ97DRAFT_1652545 [Flammula alnicola]|nr:hypothetical protein BDZ97DRAFT_1652545 [Flammula alnicola]